MTHLNWRRDQIELGHVVEKNGLLYKVVALIDEPVVVLKPLDERDGDEQEHYVITSPLFSEFALIERALPGGTTIPWRPGT